jgi:hypothetical protein
MSLRQRCTQLACYVFALLTGACQFENVGAVRESAEVTQAFESLQLDSFPDFRYWYLNTENNPFGISGLKNGYWLEGDDWHECHPQSPVFEKVVGLIGAFPAQGNSARGYYILGHQKATIGVWYSSLSAGITVDPETRKVLIATSTPWLQER